MKTNNFGNKFEKQKCSGSAEAGGEYARAAKNAGSKTNDTLEKNLLVVCENLEAQNRKKGLRAALKKFQPCILIYVK